MKTTKLLTTLLAILLFSNVLVAKDTESKLPRHLAKEMLKVLCDNVSVTEQQKRIIEASAIEYETKVLLTLADKMIVNKDEVLHIAVRKYRGVVDSVLTPVQKDSIEVRRLRELKTQSTKIRKQ